MEIHTEHGAGDLTAATRRKSQSPWAIARRKFMRNRLAMVSLGFLIVISLVSFMAPYITTADISKVNISQMELSPSAEHWLGTDKSGRDVFTRLLYGGRISLTVGISATLLIVVIGTIVGSIAGYFGGFLDNVLMRLTDFMLSLPFLIFAIAVNSLFIGKASGIWLLVLVVSFLGWGSVARIVRGKILSEKENEYILAAESIGCTPAGIIFRHLLPNVFSTVIVQATLLFATMIVVETGLSFLGFGVPEHVPSWGNMLKSARQPDVLQDKVWMWIPPAAAVTLTILSINFIGEGLKDALNPKSKR